MGMVKLVKFFKSYTPSFFNCCTIDKKESCIVCFYVNSANKNIVAIYEKPINKDFSWTKTFKMLKIDCSRNKFVGDNIGYIYLARPDKKPNILIKRIGGKLK